MGKWEVSKEEQEEEEEEGGGGKNDPKVQLDAELT